MGYVAPVLAIIGSIIIVTGTLSHPSFWIFTILGVIVAACGFWYTKKFSDS
ncbi:hypothetical protein [Lachnoclostridium sp.]|nr:hypothetical protein [Lachnoclostridium sp.]